MDFFFFFSLKHKNMPKYLIPVVYEMCGKYVIEADTLEQAKEKVFSADVGLPKGSVYIEDSLWLDEDYPNFGEEVIDRNPDYIYDEEIP